MYTRETIIESFTRTMFVDAYASFVERLHEDGEFTGDLSEPGGGENWEDFAPETTAAATEYAAECIVKIERTLNRNVEQLYEAASKACAKPGARCDRYSHSPDHFGSDLAMQFVGHGVAWDDDHAMRLELPYGEGYFIGCRADAGLGEVGSEGGDEDDGECDCGGDCNRCDT